jgi:hypothetical protein
MGLRRACNSALSGGTRTLTASNRYSCPRANDNRGPDVSACYAAAIGGTLISIVVPPAFGTKGTKYSSKEIVRSPSLGRTRVSIGAYQLDATRPLARRDSKDLLASFVIRHGCSNRPKPRIRQNAYQQELYVAFKNESSQAFGRKRHASRFPTYHHCVTRAVGAAEHQYYRARCHRH